jgi:hypothetical protein
MSFHPHPSLRLVSRRMPLAAHDRPATAPLSPTGATGPPAGCHPDACSREAQIGIAAGTGRPGKADYVGGAHGSRTLCHAAASSDRLIAGGKTAGLRASACEAGYPDTHSRLRQWSPPVGAPRRDEMATTIRPLRKRGINGADMPGWGRDFLPLIPAKAGIHTRANKTGFPLSRY